MISGYMPPGLCLMQNQPCLPVRNVPGHFQEKMTNGKPSFPRKHAGGVVARGVFGDVRAPDVQAQGLTVLLVEHRAQDAVANEGRIEVACRRRIPHEIVPCKEGSPVHIHPQICSAGDPIAQQRYVQPYQCRNRYGAEAWLRILCLLVRMSRASWP